MYIEDNTLLNIVGPSYGGDARRLLLTSDADKFINLRAHGGQLMMKGVKVRSLDRSANDGGGGADKDVTDGRSYISAISEVIGDNPQTCSGAAKDAMGEARMDIIDSQITQLGYNGAESYGVSYKVRGLCDDLSNLDIMDEVNVWGDINGTVLAYNYFGHYSFGHQGGIIDSNEVHHNKCYGLDPHDDSDFMTITDNEIHHNGCHGVVASDRCNDLMIDGNEIYSNDDVGVLLHRSSDHSTISNNYIYKNDNAGIALFETSDTKVFGNSVMRNTCDRTCLPGGPHDGILLGTLLLPALCPCGVLHLPPRADQGNNAPQVEGSDGRIRNNHIHDNLIRSPIEALKISGSEDNTFTASTAIMLSGTICQNHRRLSTFPFLCRDNIIQGQFSRFYDVVNDLYADNMWYIKGGDTDDVGDVAMLEFVTDETELTDDSKYGILVKDSCFDEDSTSGFPFCETV
eukprot:jgi/Undpi1/10889/HiC_scaffold_3.g01415.m1